MPQFQNIVVGIDISQLEPPGTEKFTPPVEEAIRRGIWLAEKAGSRLTFLTVLDHSEHSVDVLGPREQRRVVNTMEAVATRALEGLVTRAKASRVTARRTLRFGKGFVEIIRQALQEGHDLVIVGTRDLRGVKRLLMGSTAMQLLRKCPCAVWVTKPAAAPLPGLKNLAVASDFSPVSDIALDAAIGLAGYSRTKVHLINSVDYPLDRTWITGLPDAALEKYHAKIRTHAAAEMRKQLVRVEARGPKAAVEMHVVEGMLTPDVAILKFIKQHKVDLLALGTIGRTGIAGVLVGNTAERVLPQVTCSVLAFKPSDFPCPIGME